MASPCQRHHQRAQPGNALGPKVVAQCTALHKTGGVKATPAQLRGTHQGQHHAQHPDDPSVHIRNPATGEGALWCNHRIPFDIGDIVPDHPRKINKQRRRTDPQSIGKVLPNFANDIQTAQPSRHHHRNDIADNGRQPSNTKEAQPRKDHTPQSVACRRQAKP